MQVLRASFAIYIHLFAHAHAGKGHSGVAVAGSGRGDRVLTDDADGGADGVRGDHDGCLQEDGAEVSKE